MKLIFFFFLLFWVGGRSQSKYVGPSEFNQTYGAHCLEYFCNTLSLDFCYKVRVLNLSLLPLLLTIVRHKKTPDKMKNICYYYVA